MASLWAFFTAFIQENHALSNNISEEGVKNAIYKYRDANINRVFINTQIMVDRLREDSEKLDRLHREMSDIVQKCLEVQKQSMEDIQDSKVSESITHFVDKMQMIFQERDTSFRQLEEENKNLRGLLQQLLGDISNITKKESTIIDDIHGMLQEKIEEEE